MELHLLHRPRDPGSPGKNLGEKKHLVGRVSCYPFLFLNEKLMGRVIWVIGLSPPRERS